MNSGIYKFTSKTTNLSYIGQSVDIARRYNEHKRVDDGYSFHNAIKKYGWEDFEFEILEYCDIDKLNDREKYWIAYYDTYYHGYNETPGGEGSPISGKKKPVAQYDLNGNFIAAYESELDAERALGFNSKSSNISRVCSGQAYMSKGYQWRFIVNDIDYKQNIGKCALKDKLQKGALGTQELIKVAQCDRNTHKIIQIFNSIKEASITTNTQLSSIYKVISGTRKTAGGFYWVKI